MNLKKTVWLMMMLIGSVLMAPTGGWAATPDDKCTTFSTLAASIGTPAPGILTSINGFIHDTVSGASSTLFNAFIGNANYQNAVMAAATLAVTILGVAFAIGVMQASFGQILKRLFVLGIIFTVISSSGWAFFNDYVVHFFADGTDQLIGGVMSIGTGIPYSAGDSPFLPIDAIANYMVSPDMIIAIVGSATTGGSYGGFMGFLFGWCFLGFLRMLIEALRVYAVSYILRALLFGVAPVFIVFLLFEKTKPMFVSWVNALVNFSLKPVLYFTFLSFFLVLISSATQNMLGGAELCWTQYQHVQGAQNLSAGWRFSKKQVDASGNVTYVKDVGPESWNGNFSCLVSGEKCPEFPVNILDLLSFVILISLAMKFGTVVDNIANEISNSFVGVGQQAKMDIFNNKKDGGGDSGGGLQTNQGNATPRKNEPR